LPFQYAGSALTFGAVFCFEFEHDVKIIRLMEENPVNDGMNYLSAGSGFLPSTV